MLIKKLLPFIACFIIGAIIAIFLVQLFSPAATPEKGKTNSPVAKVEKYTDAAGTVHTETKVVQVEKATDNEPQYQYIIDSLAKVLKEKEKYIKDLTIVKVNQAGSFKPIYTDTVGTILHFNDSDYIFKTRVNYKDKYLDLSGVLNDDSSWHYKITEVLAITTHEKKKGWFKRELTVDFSSTNPNTSIVGITSLKVTPRPKKWGIGLNMSYSFNGTNFVPTIGIGIQRNFIRF